MPGSRYSGAPGVLATLRTRWWIVGAVTVVAVVCAVLVSRAQTAQYQASATMLFGTPSFANSGGAGSTGTTTSPEDQATDLALASLDNVAAGVKQHLRGTITADDIKRAVSVGLIGSTSLVSVTATWDDPREAALLANAFAAQIVASRRATAQANVQQSIDTIRNTIRAQRAAGAARPRGRRGASPNPQLHSLNGQLSQLENRKAVQTGDAQIVEAATPPLTADSSHVARNALIAAVVGLGIGLFLVFLLAQFDERVRDERELVALLSAPVLARVPKLPRSKRRDHTWSVQQDRAFVEAFELLRLNLQLTGLQQGHLVVGVSSPAEGDGKTTVVSALARTLALSGAEVVAVDFDLRDPMLNRCFDLPRASEGGVLGALSDTDGSVALAEVADYPHLRLLVAGQHPPPPGSIAHERLQLLLARLRDKADYVLVDTSPVSVGADASAVVAAADGVILVVDLGRVRRRDLLAAKRQLDIARTTVLGIVVNRARAEANGYAPREPLAGPVGQTSPPTFTG